MSFHAEERKLLLILCRRGTAKRALCPPGPQSNSALRDTRWSRGDSEEESHSKVVCNSIVSPRLPHIPTKLRHLGLKTFTSQANLTSTVNSASRTSNFFKN